MLLNSSATCDTVGVDILLQRLQASFGIDDAVGRWFELHLLGLDTLVKNYNHASITRFGPEG
jgi:hypothetical protein